MLQSSLFLLFLMRGRTQKMRCARNAEWAPMEGCRCLPGYEGDGFELCKDIDECAIGVCGQGSRCINLDGSFQCLCPPGYQQIESPGDWILKKDMTSQLCVAVSDCQVSDWSNWSECSVSCGAGSQARQRVIKVAPTKAGTQCPHLYETKPCDMIHQCANDCRVSDWGHWTKCSKQCGFGTKYRSRSVLEGARNGGTNCPTLEEVIPCNEFPCAADCLVSEWVSWTTCTAYCGGGTKSRHRDIIVEPAFGGNFCPALDETVRCGASSCPMDCAVSSWSQWSLCSRDCGTGGFQTRSRQMLVTPESGGAACPLLEETKPCAKDMVNPAPVCGKNAIQRGCACVCPTGYDGDPYDIGLGCIDVDECRSKRSPCKKFEICQNLAGGYECVCAEGYSKLDSGRFAGECSQTISATGFAGFRRPDKPLLPQNMQNIRSNRGRWGGGNEGADKSQYAQSSFDAGGGGGSNLAGSGQYNQVGGASQAFDAGGGGSNFGAVGVGNQAFDAGGGGQLVGTQVGAGGSVASNIPVTSNIPAAGNASYRPQVSTYGERPNDYFY
eukprot:GHVL01003665.1.p1 GENE.GHVL01003665.1~~GHVL01003665.1.p1  ORF type:complete len:553 (-),score=109.68 GHVL01003665.1:740-2398(-)